MYKKELTFCFIFLISILAFMGCEEGDGAASTSNKPKSRGALGEILLVIDSAKYEGPVGNVIKEVFQDDIKGIIRDEALFSLRKVDPRSLTRILKMANNIVYVTTFDDRNPGSRTINNLFTEDSKRMAKEDPDLFLLRSKDEFAVGQEVVYLFGNNEETLIRNLQENKKQLQNLFLTRERERLGKVLLSRKSGIASAKSREKMGIKLNLPASYQFVQEDDNFLWFRQPTPRADRADISMFFYQMDYTDEDQVFPEKIIELRNNITKTRIFADPANRDSYLVIETQVPPAFNNTTVDGNYAIEMKGAWRTNNKSMGGSFLSYTVVDEERGKIYYMEGFVYYPNEAHREALREIETVLLATELSEDS